VPLKSQSFKHKVKEIKSHLIKDKQSVVLKKLLLKNIHFFTNSIKLILQNVHGIRLGIRGSHGLGLEMGPDLTPEHTFDPL